MAAGWPTSPAMIVSLENGSSRGKWIRQSSSLPKAFTGSLREIWTLSPHVPQSFPRASLDWSFQRAIIKSPVGTEAQLSGSYIRGAHAKITMPRPGCVSLSTWKYSRV
jgi:hypothetical protein